MKQGFSLIELMVAVLLLALLGSAAAISLSGPIRAARAGDAIGAVRRADTYARSASISKHGMVTLKLEPGGGAIDLLEDEQTSQAQARFAMPAGFHIDRLATAEGEALRIEVSPSGLSRTYAVLLIGPGSSQWIVFSGLSGQCIAKDSEPDAMAALAGGR